MSPGELRLDRDIESLILGKQWTSTVQSPEPIENSWPRHNANHHGSSVPSWDRRGSRIHGELFCPNARLVRDPVDPLRLRLTCLHQPTSPNNNAQSSSPLPPEQWTFLIQMPRMYPHVPPVITRVTRDFVPNNENMAHLGNMNVNYGYSASAAIVASSVIQSQVEPPVPDQILIHLLPPTPNMGFHGGNNQGSKLLDIDLATSVHNAWSPVSSLQDLIDFLVGIPARRREWWGVENNRRHHQQQHCSLGYHAGSTIPVGQPTIAPAATSFLDSQHYQSFHQPKQHHFSSSHCDMEDDGEINNVESMMEDARHPFTANRFDVGYEKFPKPCRQWGVR